MCCQFSPQPPRGLVWIGWVARVSDCRPPSDWGSSVGSRREQFRHAEKVVGGAYEVSGKLCPLEPAEACSSKAADGLHPAEDLLDTLSYLQTDGITGMPRRSFVDRRAASRGVLREVRRDVAIATRLHEVSGIIAFVTREGDATLPRKLVIEHRKGDVSLCGARCWPNSEVHQKAVPVLHERVRRQ